MLFCGNPIYCFHLRCWDIFIFCWLFLPYVSILLASAFLFMFCIWNLKQWILWSLHVTAKFVSFFKEGALRTLRITHSCEVLRRSLSASSDLFMVCLLCHGYGKMWNSLWLIKMKLINSNAFKILRVFKNENCPIFFPILIACYLFVN